MTPPTPAPSLAAQLACAERICTQAQSAYPRLVQTGYLSHREAQHELACLKAIVHTLQGLVGRGVPLRSQADLFGERSK